MATDSRWPIGQESTAISTTQPYSNLCLNSGFMGGTQATLPLVSNNNLNLTGCAIGGSDANNYESPTLSWANNITMLRSRTTS